MRLDGQTAIVTGGGRGLGRAIAETLASLGAHVVIASRNAPELDEVVLRIKRSRGRALAYAADVSDERQVQDLVINTERWVGPATILVNNAGIIEPITPLARSDATTWLRHIAINLGGVYLTTRAVLPGMLERGYGRIVNISSHAAERPSAGWTAYTAGKAAVEQLTRSLGVELERTGVTVCALRPGKVETALQERVRRSSAEDFPRVEEYREAKRAGQVADPKDRARIVAYLVSDGAQRNGQIVEPDEALERVVAEALDASP
ncbi:MAG: SDR family NAD(P)-dependent oxidoreductase [Candidatus Limnocylindria bacterium]|nr:SDR family oxidoreductase [Chloroflexota bacterium]